MRHDHVRIAANVFAHVGAELDQVPAELQMGGAA